MKNAYIKFILAAVIFGTNGIIASQLPLSSYEIVLLLATARHEWGSLRHVTRASLGWLVLSGLFLAGNWLFLYEAYQQIGVSLATLMCYCGPILIMILSYFVFHEPFTVPKVSAMVIVTIGIVCINGADVQAHGLSWGLVCGFLSALCFALLSLALPTYSQGSNEAKAVLDKTASIVKRSGAMEISFTASSFMSGVQKGNLAGTIYLKGRKFHIISTNILS
ncbi:EamA family transporter, partial [uncultured Megasphaera sp.]|uniref:EamA family transporter n=1 Tax=uncultured Megasphaera sp. TaxID=165188 RepID=UPI002582AF07